MVAGVELTYNTGASAVQMAQTIFGEGVSVVDATYIGDNDSSAIYSNGDTISEGVVPGDTGVILSTGEAVAFTSVGPQSNVTASLTTPSSGPNNDPQFVAAAGLSTFDASILEVDFIPDADVNFVTMTFVFASDEYPEFVGSIYNDMFAVWINDDLVPLSVGDDTVSIGNLNEVGGPNLFNLNTSDQFNTEMDGFTVSLSLVIPVEAGEENTMRIGITDVGDRNYDSNVLIAADSVQGGLIANEDNILLRPGDAQIVDVLANDFNDTGGAAFITHINDVAVNPGDSVTLTTGQTITLNADGTLSMIGNDVSEDVALTYEIATTTGQTAVGLIVVDTVPCFAAGSLIRTKRGDVPVEELCLGDMVFTRDDGFQPVRWIGRRDMPAEGKMAPVRIAPNTFGEHAQVTVSPLHRIFLQNMHAELLFGSSEVLVAARDLIDGKQVQRIEGGQVEYVHLMFDRHQVIWSDGLPSESFFPGSQTQNCFEQSALEEICAIFPELDPVTGKGYGPTVRPALKRYEARLLVA